MHRVAAVALALALPVVASAGLDLGIKLACQRYGAAFVKGDRAAVMAACTPEFARQWARLPEETFRRLPRPSGQRVVASQCQGGCGWLLAASSAGTVRFQLVGSGFDWRIADLLRMDERGDWTSVRQTLDAALTTHEMIQDLKSPHSLQLLGSVTPGFARELVGMDRAEFARVRRFMPQPKLHGVPTVRIGADVAEVRASMPRGAAGGGARVTLRPADGWKVDDFALRTPRLDIPSFRQALPGLVAATSFAEFAKNPAKVAPIAFTVPGKLRDALQYAATLAPSPFPKPGTPVRFSAKADAIEIDYPARKVRMELESGKMADLVVTSPLQSGSVASMLIAKRDAEEQLAKVGQWFGLGAATPTPESPLQAVAIAAGAAVEPPAAVEPAAAEPEPAPAKPAKRAANVRLPARSLAAAERKAPVRTQARVTLAPAGMQRVPVRTTR